MNYDLDPKIMYVARRYRPVKKIVENRLKLSKWYTIIILFTIGFSLGSVFLGTFIFGLIGLACAVLSGIIYLFSQRKFYKVLDCIGDGLISGEELIGLIKNNELDKYIAAINQEKLEKGLFEVENVNVDVYQMAKKNKYQPIENIINKENKKEKKKVRKS